MLSIMLPLFVALIGLVMFIASKTNADLKEIGKWLFICGLFWSVSPFVSKSINIVQ